MGGSLYLFNSRAGFALDGLHANLVETLHEEVAVFGVDDGLHWCSQHLDTISFQHPVAVELHAAVEGCLSSKTQQDAIGAFFLDDTFHEIGLHRLEVHLVGYSLGCLHRGNIRIDEHRLDALFP